ncbi:hydrogenase nickel incorporation protein HypB [Desulfuribacillus alkaliarsenatis]|uniref:Hydrogenase accessory protein HypB n=1 Tax=Desulfuribacillus alkaliarsenatis TaxID=766136 RepID=A0A1E5FZ44_9FIRM|nr:hydrogenase nickel incorporation protein HypB [Desulfuribacillus alkaliarsenatis]OEF95808.1 hydrogenase accessory protein HypB [Desulfuribacillus alkaliarsenatis]
MTTKIEVKKSPMQKNNEQAELNRQLLKEKGIFALNLMSSPGSGKTTLLEKLSEVIGDDIKMGIIEGDLATERDADRIRAKGIQCVQINTDGGCHMDSHMIRKVLDEFDLDKLDLLIIENVGNLVCPSSWDLGEHKRAVVLSVTEGADKVAKYPTMFRKADAVILNKIDLIPYIQFNVDIVKDDLFAIKPGIEFFELSATTGENMEAWCQWLKDHLHK